MTSAQQTSTAPPPQAPTVGFMRRLLGRFYFTGVFWYRFHLFGVSVVPEWAVGSIIRVFTFVFFIALYGVRRAVISNLSLVLGPAGFWESQRRAWRTIHMFAWCLSERYEQFVPGKDFHITHEHLERWAAAKVGGRGAVVVTAHVGNWEVASVVPARAEERVVHVIREEELDQRAQEFVAELLQTHGGEQYRTHFATDDPALGLRLLDALRSGDVVALQGDRPRAGGKVAEARLFGRSFELPVGPAALARAAEVPIVPVFTLREGRRRYRIFVEEPINVPKTADRAADHQVAIQGLADAIERTVRGEPHQWFCFADVGARAPFELAAPTTTQTC